MAHKIPEICGIWMHERTQELIGEGCNPTAAGKIIADEIWKMYEISIPSKTIAKRVEREKKRNATNVENNIISISNNKEILDRKIGKGQPDSPRKYPTPAPKTVFNETNGNVEWARWTWNPITGCLHGCEYCYARSIAKRFYPSDIGFKPHFWPERLMAPVNTSVPKSGDIRDRAVFTVSMGDLFGEWVPVEQVQAVLKVIEENPQWLFLLLTKNPERLAIGLKNNEWEYPINVWIGVTADTQNRADIALDVLYSLHHFYDVPNIKYLSIEPFIEPIDLSKEVTVHAGSIQLAECLNWVILGGKSVSGSFVCSTCGYPGGYQQPEWEWVENIWSFCRSLGIPVYFKPNLTVRPKEYPQLG